MKAIRTRPPTYEEYRCRDEPDAPGIDVILMEREAKTAGTEATNPRMPARRQKAACVPHELVHGVRRSHSYASGLTASRLA